MTTIKIPEWYGASKSYDAGDDRSRAGRSVRRTLAAIGQTLAEELSGSRGLDSWLSCIEPRARILGVLVLVFGTTLLHAIMPLLVTLVAALGLALASGLPVRRLGRLLLGAPILSAVIVAPAVLSIVTKGHAILTICHLSGSSVAVTREGLAVALRFILRSIDCVIFAAVLVGGMDSATLVNALRRLGMPRVFGMAMAMMQRYLALLLRTAEEIHMAKLSRTIGSRSIRSEHRWVASGMGVLFSKTYMLAEEVSRAMVSRGYGGDLRVRNAAGLRGRDFAWVFGAVLVIFGLLLMERLQW